MQAVARTQSSLALSVDKRRWLLCNASPDIHRQIAQTPALQPRATPRDSGIAAVMLVDGQIDHATGLLLLRERSTPLPLWTTSPVHDDLTSGLPLLSVLQHYCGVAWHGMPIDGTTFTMPVLPGISITALPVTGKPGPYSSYRDNPRSGDNVGLVFREQATGRQLFYAPGLAAVTPQIAAVMRDSHCVLVDGTFWSDDEMILQGVSQKRARDLGHLPQSGAGGMIEELERLPTTCRRILIHINNTNPILDGSGAERARLRAAGIEVAYDGMEIAL